MTDLMDSKTLLEELEQKKNETEKALDEGFIKAYGELVEKYGREIVSSPTFTQTANGVFSVTIQYTVVKSKK